MNRVSLCGVQCASLQSQLTTRYVNNGPEVLPQEAFITKPDAKNSYCTTPLIALYTLLYGYKQRVSYK